MFNLQHTRLDKTEENKVKKVTAKFPCSKSQRLYYLIHTCLLFFSSNYQIFLSIHNFSKPLNSQYNCQNNIMTGREILHKIKVTQLLYFFFFGFNILRQWCYIVHGVSLFSTSCCCCSSYFLSV